MGRSLLLLVSGNVLGEARYWCSGDFRKETITSHKLGSLGWSDLESSLGHDEMEIRGEGSVTGSRWGFSRLSEQATNENRSDSLGDDATHVILWVAPINKATEKAESIR